jgi:DHA2 family multidrug resistance protein-like MFS transporter
MGFAMAPATDAIMGSLPLEHAGVGSAMNDVVRQVGGTLGVAVLGSVLSSSYGSSMHGATSGLPDSTATAAADSVGGAAQVAHGIGGQAGATLLHASQGAFVDAMGVTVIVAAAAALLGSVIAMVFLPAREPGAEKAAVEAGALAEAVPA